MMMNRILTFSFLSILLACSSFAQQKIAGCYRSNFTEMGMFGVKLSLNQDSSFYYKFAGDMMVQDGKGIYYFKKDTIFLIFDKNAKLDDLAGNMISSHTLIKQDIKLLYKNEKIYFLNAETEKRVKYEHGYSKKRKYILFGSHYFAMKYYLKSVPCEIQKLKF